MFFIIFAKKYLSHKYLLTLFKSWRSIFVILLSNVFKWSKGHLNLPRNLLLSKTNLDLDGAPGSSSGSQWWVVPAVDLFSCRAMSLSNNTLTKGVTFFSQLNETFFKSGVGSPMAFSCPEEPLVTCLCLSCSGWKLSLYLQFSITDTLNVLLCILTCFWNNFMHWTW